MRNVKVTRKGRVFGAVFAELVHYLHPCMAQLRTEGVCAILYVDVRRNPPCISPRRMRKKHNIAWRPLGVFKRSLLMARSARVTTAASRLDKGGREHVIENSVVLGKRNPLQSSYSGYREPLRRGHVFESTTAVTKPFLAH